MIPRIFLAFSEHQVGYGQNVETSKKFSLELLKIKQYFLFVPMLRLRIGFQPRWISLSLLRDIPQLYGSDKIRMDLID